MNQEFKTGSFITKVHSIVSNKNFEPIIKFDQDEGKLYIFNRERLEDEVLPLFFRHNKFTSFIRQLNLYGFKKIRNSSALCFTHSCLLKGKLLISIIAKKKQKAMQKQLYSTRSRNGNLQQIGQYDDNNEMRLQNIGLIENSDNQNAQQLQGNRAMTNQQPSVVFRPMNYHFQNFQRTGSSQILAYYFPVQPFFLTTPFLHFYMPGQEK